MTANTVRGNDSTPTDQSESRLEKIWTSRFMKNWEVYTDFFSPLKANTDHQKGTNVVTVLPCGLLVYLSSWGFFGLRVS